MLTSYLRNMNPDIVVYFNLVLPLTTLLHRLPLGILWKRIPVAFFFFFSNKRFRVLCLSELIHRAFTYSFIVCGCVFVLHSVEPLCLSVAFVQRSHDAWVLRCQFFIIPRRCEVHGKAPEP